HDRGARALKSLWSGFVVPFSKAIRTAVEKAAYDYQPDVMVVDQHALAGAAVAHRLGLRWATLCPQAMELTRPLRDRPRVEAWIAAQMAQFCDDPGVDLRYSPHLNIAFTGEVLTGPVSELPDRVVL